MNISQCKSKNKQRWSKIAFPGALASFTARHYSLSSVVTGLLCGCTCGPTAGARTENMQTHIHTHTHTKTHTVRFHRSRKSEQLRRHSSAEWEQEEDIVLPFSYCITKLIKGEGGYDRCSTVTWTGIFGINLNLWKEFVCLFKKGRRTRVIKDVTLELHEG